LNKISLTKRIVSTILMLAVIAGNFFSLKNMTLTFAVLIIWGIYISGVFEQSSEKVIEDDPDDEVLSDEEMDEFILDNGEFSYDNYEDACCPKCGDFLGIDVTICPSCGYNKDNQPQVCEQCGKVREDDIDFCPYCNRNYSN